MGTLFHGGGRESKGTNKSLFINAPVACNLMGRKEGRGEGGWTGFFPASLPLTQDTRAGRLTHTLKVKLEEAINDDQLDHGAPFLRSRSRLRSLRLRSGSVQCCVNMLHSPNQADSSGGVHERQIAVIAAMTAEALSSELLFPSLRAPRASL